MEKKISKLQAIEMCLSCASHFKERWESYLEEWKEEGTPGFTVDITEFAYYLQEECLSSQLNIPHLQKCFRLVEDLLVKGDEEVSTAIATGLLESLLHHSDEEPRLDGVFVPLLGRESKKYCIAYNKFCGVKNKGL